MREPMTAGKASPPATGARATPIEVVCVALLVAFAVLAARIATIW